MRTINVDPNVLAMPSYGSAAEAIAAEKNTPRAARSSVDSASMAGAFIRGFSVSDQKVCLNLSNGISVELAVVGARVEWRLSNLCVVESGGGGQREGLRLIWPDGDASEWNPVRLLESRKQYEIINLFAGQTFVNVYFKRGGSLQFVSLWNSSDRQPLLHFFELEPPLPAREN